MIRLGIVGCNYGLKVQLPAFRLDPRCEVAAVAGSDAARTAEHARRAGIGRAFGGWSELIAEADIDAVAVATPPHLQPEIASAALRAGKAVFLEKPLAADLAGAVALLGVAGSAVAMIDFNFTEVTAFRQAKAMLDAGAIGRLRHVAVAWNVENASTRLRLRNWKTEGGEGGGAVGNFGSHSLHYLEWFCGPITGLMARISGLPDDPSFETNVTLAAAFASGASGSYALSCASYLGSGHRLEFYGEDGMLTLANSTADYMRGFSIAHARRPATAPVALELEADLVDRQFPDDGRIAPVARLAKRFLDAVERRRSATPNIGDGYRVQFLLDAVRKSHAGGCWIETIKATP